MTCARSGSTSTCVTGISSSSRRRLMTPVSSQLDIPWGWVQHVVGGEAAQLVLDRSERGVGGRRPCRSAPRRRPSARHAVWPGMDPGAHGTRLGSRDEIICALRVMSVDEVVIDPRFERRPIRELGPRASWHVYGLRATRARPLPVLTATNDDHFVASGGVTHPHARGAERSAQQCSPIVACTRSRSSTRADSGALAVIYRVRWRVKPRLSTS